MNIINKFKHEEYNRTSKLNDIALLKLWDEVVFSERVQPACLPHRYSSRLPRENTVAMFAGWGRDESNDSDIEMRNMKINVYDWTKAESRCSISNWKLQICAGNING